MLFLAICTLTCPKPFIKIPKNFLCVLDLFLDIFVMCYVLSLDKKNICGIFLLIVTMLVGICEVLYVLEL
jgi:hypothetical protein